MAVYDLNGTATNTVYNIEGTQQSQAYNVIGNALIASWYSSLSDSGYTFTDGVNTTTTKLMLNFGTTNFQSLVLAQDKFYRGGTTATVYPYDDTLSALTSITLPSTGGHKNDGCYYDGKIYWLDGTADYSKLLYTWDITANTIAQITLPVTDNANGSKRVVAGICNADTIGIMYLVSRDQYNGSDIDHQEGDLMCVYEYDVTNNTVNLVGTFEWDCVYVQGATYYNGVLYVSCNTATTGSASNYTGITIKQINTSNWTIAKTLTCSGDFEPQGCDHLGNYIWTGLNKYSTTNKVIVWEV